MTTCRTSSTVANLTNSQRHSEPNPEPTFCETTRPGGLGFGALFCCRLSCVVGLWVEFCKCRLLHPSHGKSHALQTSVAMMQSAAVILLLLHLFLVLHFGNHFGKELPARDALLFGKCTAVVVMPWLLLCTRCVVLLDRSTLRVETTRTEFLAFGRLMSRKRFGKMQVRWPSRRIILRIISPTRRTRMASRKQRNRSTLQGRG